jgi:hypothetical protein
VSSRSWQTYNIALEVGAGANPQSNLSLLLRMSHIKLKFIIQLKVFSHSLQDELLHGTA